MKAPGYTPSKIIALLKAARAQLSQEEFDRLNDLLGQLQVRGLTPAINAELGKLISKLDWELEEAISPEWEDALIECDRAFLQSELRQKCREMGISDFGHKKTLCGRLYRAGETDVVRVMEPFMGGQS